MSFASFFGCSLDVKQTKQMAVDVKHSSHVKHRTVDVVLFLRSSTEREFTAEMSQHMF